jgi:hypothetical protein
MRRGQGIWELWVGVEPNLFAACMFFRMVVRRRLHLIFVDLGPLTGQGLRLIELHAKPTQNRVACGPLRSPHPSRPKKPETTKISLRLGDRTSRLFSTSPPLFMVSRQQVCRPCPNVSSTGGVEVFRFNSGSSRPNFHFLRLVLASIQTFFVFNCSLFTEFASYCQSHLFF